METYFDSRIDLWQRRLQKHSDRLKSKAEETFKLDTFKIRDISGDLLAENFEREFKNFKLKVSILLFHNGPFLTYPLLGLDTHDNFGGIMALG
jgi:hypothetical protein